MCSYFDLEAGPDSRLPQMSFVKDATVGEGESVPPDTTFVKTWKVQNTGSERWPDGEGGRRGKLSPNQCWGH